MSCPWTVEQSPHGRLTDFTSTQKERGKDTNQPRACSMSIK